MLMVNVNVYFSLLAINVMGDALTFGCFELLYFAKYEKM